MAVPTVFVNEIVPQATTVIPPPGAKNQISTEGLCVPITKVLLMSTPLWKEEMLLLLAEMDEFD